jgi:hypothetical protein
MPEFNNIAADNAAKPDKLVGVAAAVAAVEIADTKIYESQTAAKLKKSGGKRRIL